MNLSPRECEILTLVSYGFPNRKIAAQLGMKDDTVKSHLARISRKLGTGDRTGMAIYALRLGAIPTVPNHIAPPVPPDSLTKRRRDILRLVAEGWDNDTIARTLYLAADTIKSHLRLIALAMGLPCNRTLLATVGFRDRLL